MNQNASRRVDQSALHVNQAFIIGLLVMAFVMDSVWTAAFVGMVMLLGTAVPPLSLFKRIYQHLLTPNSCWLSLDIITDNPEPHRFAQGFGGMVVMIGISCSSIGHWLDGSLGWSLTAVVASSWQHSIYSWVFAPAVFIYYQLQRLGVFQVLNMRP